MSLGSWINAPDNDSYMLRGPNPHRSCAGCGLSTDNEWIDPEFALTKTGFDASYTYDGYLIASQRFFDFARPLGARGIALPSVPGFVSLRIDQTVEFDVVRRKTRFEDLCPECGRYAAVAGATPIFLADPEPLPDRFLRTDVEFGTGDERCPLVLVGPRLAHDLERAAFRGIQLTPIV